LPQVLVPGVAQVVLSGTVSAHPWAVIFHFKLDLSGQNWSISQLNATCTGLHTGAFTHIAALTGSNVTFSTCTGVDLGTTTPAEGVSSHAAFSGTLVAPESPPSLCVLVSYQTQDRYRGGHPRAYMPPPNAATLTPTEDAWQGSYINSYSVAFANMMDDTFAAQTGMFQCAVRYNYTFVDDPVHHKYLRTRASLHSTPQVLNWIPKAPVATQRRRIKTGG